MDATTDFSTFHDKITSKLVQTTRIVGQLSNEDLNFHRSYNSEFAELLDEQSDRILSLTSSLLKTATAGTDVKAPALRNEDSIDDNWRGVVDVIDNLLEKADACLDEFTGIIKRLSPSQQEEAQPSKKKFTPKFPSIYDHGPSKFPKPQLKFQRLPDNTDVSPFRPLLRTKPHAQVPLEPSLQLIESQDEPPHYPHPYETEIRNLKYPSSTYVSSPAIDYEPFESTSATFVDTFEGVTEMLTELKSAKEIAIDLEHHDTHSYYGLVSLMQISTRNKDWVIDTLKPWREELQVLNEVFADPSILKVLHGSTMDVIWLQRDLGLYLVGLFDTYHASSALRYPKKSLKYLLEKFVNFQADKRYQIADWRVRPLPPGMFDYARSDTHYLLYIFDHLRNELLEESTPKNNLIDYVLERSKVEALQRYERPVYDSVNGQGPGGWYDYLSRNSGPLTKEQFAVFKAVHQWRDEVARAEDEGVAAVFPKHVLFRIAQAMPLDEASLFRTISPVTLLVKDRASALLEVIKTAKEAGADGPEWRDVVRPVPVLDASVAPIAKTAPNGAVDEEDIKTRVLMSASRLDDSQFWGRSLHQPPSDLVAPAYSLAASAEALRLSLPIPSMPITVKEAQERLGVNTAAPVPSPLQPSSPGTNPVESSEIFTVKEVAGRRKRKIKSPEDGEAMPSLETDESNSTGPSDGDRAQKNSKKSRRKESGIAANSPKSSTQKPVDDSVPFDYSTAPSILHAKPEPPPGGTSLSKQSKQTFNPYTKALDTSTGLRRPKKETSGKSFTFRD